MFIYVIFFCVAIFLAWRWAFDSVPIVLLALTTPVFLFAIITLGLVAFGVIK